MMTDPKPVLLRELTDAEIEDLWVDTVVADADLTKRGLCVRLRRFARACIAKATEMPAGSHTNGPQRFTEGFHERNLLLQEGKSVYEIWVPAPTSTVTLKGKEFTRAELEEGLAQIGKE